MSDNEEFDYAKGIIDAVRDAERSDPLEEFEVGLLNAGAVKEAANAVTAQARKEAISGEVGTASKILLDAFNRRNQTVYSDSISVNEQDYSADLLYIYWNDLHIDGDVNDYEDSYNLNYEHDENTTTNQDAVTAFDSVVFSKKTASMLSKGVKNAINKEKKAKSIGKGTNVVLDVIKKRSELSFGKKLKSKTKYVTGNDIFKHWNKAIELNKYAKSILEHNSKVRKGEMDTWVDYPDDIVEAYHSLVDPRLINIAEKMTNAKFTKKLIMSNPYLALDLLTLLWARDPLMFVNFNFPWFDKGLSRTVESRDGSGEIVGTHSGAVTWQFRLLNRVGHFIRSGQCRTTKPLKLSYATNVSAGKGAAFAWLHIFPIVCVPYTRMMTVANTLTQLESRLWSEVLQWASRSIYSYKINATKTYIARNGGVSSGLNSNSSMGFWQGTTQLYNVADTDSLQGLHGLGSTWVFGDEATGFPREVCHALEGNVVTKFSVLMYACNPVNSTCYVADTFLKESMKESWIAENISVFDCETGSFASEKAMRLEHGEYDPQYRQRMLGEFTFGSEDTVLSEETINHAVERGRNVQTSKLSYNPLYNESDYERILGVDLGFSGSDPTFLVIREGNRLIYSERFALSREQIYSEQASIITADKIVNEFYKRNVKIVTIDAGGAGSSVADLVVARLGLGVVRRVIFNNTAQDPSKFKNVRAEIWWKMRDWFANAVIMPTVRPDHVNILLNEARMVTYERQSADGDKIQLISKKILRNKYKVSTDFGDAIATTMVIKSHLTLNNGQNYNNISNYTETSGSNTAYNELMGGREW